jgi:hypothetical protein
VIFHQLLLLLLLLLLLICLQFTSFSNCQAAAVTQSNCSSLALAHCGAIDVNLVAAVGCSSRCER